MFVKNGKIYQIMDLYWIWAGFGSLLLWILIGIMSGQFNLESLLANSMSASFLGFAALGQMVVIATGRGAIDLSVPGIITLTGFLSTGVIDGNNALIPLGLVVIFAVGALIGLVNSISVIDLKVPPMIATLAMSYILVTVSLIYNQIFQTFKISTIMTFVSKGRIFGIPFVIILLIIFGILISIMMKKTVFGWSLTALGQSKEAAKLAGIKIKTVERIAYVFSGLSSALAGLLISSRVGGAFLQMGEPYMLETVGAVVIGGSLIFGGRSSTMGTLFGCLFLVLIVTSMQVAGFNIGVQRIIKGLLLILVLSIAAGGKQAEV